MHLKVSEALKHAKIYNAIEIRIAQSIFFENIQPVVI